LKQYKDAGVDIEAGYSAVEKIKKHVNRTRIPGVLTGIGSFGGLFELDVKKYKNPVLVSGTDGVGTKLKVAYALDKHDTIGIDCVAMSVNDVLCMGAEPLFFLDYIAIDKLIPEKVELIVKGVAEGCMQSECALIGGETAEMPGIYAKNEYDIAGFAVGVVEKEKAMDSAKVKVGDVLIGLKSSGAHSNGYSLIRRIFGIDNASKSSLLSYVQDLGKSLGEALIEPTRIYVKSVKAVLNKYDVHGISHITGGGFIENIPRMLPDDLKAVINTKSYEIPPIFEYMRKFGKVELAEMYNVFNMGIGMVLAVNSADVNGAVKVLQKYGEQTVFLGEVKAGKGGVELC